jgi:hypothetical protein
MPNPKGITAGGQIRRFACLPGPVIAATDASWKKEDQRAGLGYITTDGRWAAIGQQWSPNATRVAGPPCADVFELRAMAALLVPQLGLPGRSEPPDLVLTDNSYSLKYLGAWQDGRLDVMPPGYRPDGLRKTKTGTRPAALVLLARRVYRLAGRTRFQRIQGHSGILLNEAADQLARIGRCGTELTTRREAFAVADSTLADWHSAGTLLAAG